MASELMIAMWTLPVGFAIVRAKCVSQLLMGIGPAVRDKVTAR